MDRDDIRKVLAKDAKLYIFDMDGTILNSMVEWFHLGRNYLVAQGVAVPDDLEQRIETMTMDESAEYFQSLGVDKSVPEINEGIFAYIREKYRTSIPAKEGMLSSFWDSCRIKSNIPSFAGIDVRYFSRI